MTENPRQSKNFQRTKKVIYGFLAAVFFLIGFAYLPFLVWLGNGMGTKPWLGDLIILFSVVVPWGIGSWFLNLALRSPKVEENPPID